MSIKSAESIAEVDSVSGLIDYLANSAEGVAAFVLVLTGAAAWAAKTYVSALVWHYRKRLEVNELANILASDIKNSIEGYRRIFTPEAKAANIKTLNEMQRKRKYRAFVIAVEDDRFQNELAKELKILPSEMAEAYACFRIAELEFDASYKALGNPSLAVAGYMALRNTIDEVFRDSDACIQAGEAAVRVLKSGSQRNQQLNNIVLITHAGIVVILVLLAIKAVLNWPF